MPRPERLPRKTGPIADRERARWTRICLATDLVAAIDARVGYRDTRSDRDEDTPTSTSDWLTSHPSGAVACCDDAQIWIGDLGLRRRVLVRLSGKAGDIEIRSIEEMQSDLFGPGRTLFLGPAIPRRSWDGPLKKALRTRRSASPRTLRPVRPKKPQRHLKGIRCRSTTANAPNGNDVTLFAMPPPEM